MPIHIERNSPGQGNALQRTPNPETDSPSTFQVDQRPEAAAQRRIQSAANQSPHVSQLRAMQSGANQAPVQRKLKVDAINDGEEFEDLDFVPAHFGLSSAAQVLYKQWVSDDQDHHFPTKGALVQALEAAAQPTTDSFRDIFTTTAGTEGVSTHWMEQHMTGLEGSFKTIGQYTPEEVAEVITMWSPMQVTAQDIEGYDLGTLMSALLNAGVMSQSCGNTANLFHEILSPSTADANPIGTDLNGVIGAFRDANAKSAKTLKHQYVHLEGGGHAFIVEVFNDTARIYQSFFGRYSFAKDLDRDKSYGLGEFIGLMTRALTAGEAQTSKSARQEVFSSMAVHPDNQFRVNSFEAEDGAGGRLATAHQTGKAAWDPHKGNDATDHLAAPPLAQAQAAPSLPPMTVMDYDFDTIAGMLDFGSGISEKEVEAGNAKVGSHATYGTFRFKVESKSATNYKMVYDPV